jgi:hypothetical protein
MLQEVLVSPERLDGSRAIAQNEALFGPRGLQATLQISRCGEIENAIAASEVVSLGQGPVGNSIRECRSTEYRSVRLGQGEEK